MPTDTTIEIPVPPAKLVTFHRLIPTARLPQRADRSAAGMLPTRAFRYCEPATTASGFGYYVFPPMDFSLRFDGYDVLWTWQGVGEWFPIPKLGSVQFPGFRDYFASVAPADCAEFAPPFMAVLQEAGLVQIWTGLMVRTAPGWSLLVRSPANFGRPGGYEAFEGIVETDHWFGPLNSNVRLLNDFDAATPFSEYDVNVDFYRGEINQCVEEVEPSIIQGSLFSFV